MSNYKGFRMVEATRLANGNVQRIALTRWMTREDAFAFARLRIGGGTVESKRGVLYSIVNNYNDHAKSWGF